MATKQRGSLIDLIGSSRIPGNILDEPVTAPATGMEALLEQARTEPQRPPSRTQLASEPELQEREIEEREQRVSEDLRRQRKASEERMASGEKMGVSDVAREIAENPTEYLPYLSFLNDLEFFRSATRIQKGEGTDADFERMRLEEQKVREREARGETIPGKAVGVLAKLPAFGVEFAASGGVSNAVKKGAQKIATRMGREVAKEAVELGTKEKVVRAVGDRIASTAIRTGAMPTRVLESYLQRTNPGVQIEEGTAGDIKVNLIDSDESPMVALGKAMGDVGIEVFSESFGGIMDDAWRALKPVARDKALRMGLVGLWSKSGKPPSRLAEVAKSAGFNGVAQEVIEERVGEVLRSTFNISETELEGMDNTVANRLMEQARKWATADFGEQLLVETLAFSVPGATVGISNNFDRIKTAARKSVENILSDESGALGGSEGRVRGRGMMGDQGQGQQEEEKPIKAPIKVDRKDEDVIELELGGRTFGTHVAITKSLSSDGGWRVTEFDGDSPLGHREAKNYQEALEMAENIFRADTAEAEDILSLTRKQQREESVAQPVEPVQQQEIPKQIRKQVAEQVREASRTTQPPSAGGVSQVTDEYSGIPQFKMSDETKVEAVRRAIEDMNVRIKKFVQDFQEFAGKQLQDHLDLYLLKDMMPRVISNEIKKFSDMKTDIVASATENGVDIERAGQISAALHAKDRNRVMIERAEEEGRESYDGMSGMTDAEAEALLASATPQELEIAEKAQQIARETLQYQVDNGLLSEEEAQAYKDVYGENYVPMFRDLSEEADFTGIPTNTGRSVSVVGRGSKRAVGSEKRVVNPLASAVFQAEQARVRKIKNDVGLAIIELVENNPSLEGMFSVEAQQFIPRFDSNGELLHLDPKFQFADNVIGARKDGKQYFITINDPLLARALKATDIAKMPAAMRVLRSALGIWSSMKTRWRPEFLVTNFERDLGEALVNLGVESEQLGKQGKGLRREVVKNIFPSQRAILKHITGRETSEEVQEFFDLGGDTGHFWLQDYLKAERSMEQLQSDLQNPSPARRAKLAGKRFLDAVDNINTMVELGVRYSTYRALVSRGMSKKRAIQSAADLTVNFSRQGEASAWLKSLYGFIQPAINGTSKVIRSMTRGGAGKRYSKRVLGAVSGLAMMGFATRMASMLIDPDGDEQMPDWTKNHKLAIANGKGGVWTLWSMPYGYAPFYSIGSNLAEYIMGKKSEGEVANSIASTSLNSFSPIGTDPYNYIPTLRKPFTEIQSNRAWYDGPVRPEQIYTNTPEPNNEVYFKSASAQSIFAAQFINRLAGGGPGKSAKFMPEWFDRSPNDYQYLYDQLIGGPVEFATSSIDAIATGINGEFDPNKTPFVRQFYRDGRPEQWSYKVIFDTLEGAKKTELSDQEVDKFYKAVDLGLAEEVYDESRADQFVREFISARYGIVGQATDEENAQKIYNMPPEDRDRYINSYSESSQKRIKKNIRMLERREKAEGKSSSSESTGRMTDFTHLLK